MDTAPFCGAACAVMLHAAGWLQSNITTCQAHLCFIVFLHAQAAIGVNSIAIAYAITDTCPFVMPVKSHS